MRKAVIYTSTILLLNLMIGSCSKVRGPKGLRQSEWVAWCTINPTGLLCQYWSTAAGTDSIYTAGLLFEKNSLREYRLDSIFSSGAYQVFFNWIELVPAGSELEVVNDSVFLDNNGVLTTLFKYGLVDNMLEISSVNSTMLRLEPGTRFSLVDGIPENHPEIPE